MVYRGKAVIERCRYYLLTPPNRRSSIKPKVPRMPRFLNRKISSRYDHTLPYDNGDKSPRGACRARLCPSSGLDHCHWRRGSDDKPGSAQVNHPRWWPFPDPWPKALKSSPTVHSFTKSRAQSTRRKLHVRCESFCLGDKRI